MKSVTERAVEPVGVDRDLIAFRQLTTHFSTVNMSIIGNLINAVITALVFVNDVSPWFLTSGLSVLSALLIWRISLVRQMPATFEQTSLIRDIGRKVEINAACLGMFWGLAFGLLFESANGTQQMFLGILASGMMSVGIITFRTRAKAATLYVSACCPGFLIGFFSTGTAAAMGATALMFCYLAVLLRHVRTNSATFNEAIAREEELTRSSQTIQLLLNDYAEQGSDWLIELAADGKIINPSQRFAEAALRPVETLAGKHLIRLLDQGEETDQLAHHLRSHSVFRHLPVSMTIDGEQRWWSISGRVTDAVSGMFRAVATDITAQRHAEEKVSYMAHYDGLTDLPNRFLFNDSLYRALLRNNGVAGLMYLDLDQFKGVNDTLGHPVGDKLLRAVARRLEQCVSESELIARLGGDEFAILVPADRIDQIDAMSERIVTAISQPFQLGEHDVVVGTSIGIACAPEHGDDADCLLRNADLALYAAKSAGRNCACRFEPGMDEAARIRRMIETDLRIALTNDQMRLHYQPLVEGGSGRTTGYEALVRWEHPERGIMMPNLFIPIAEETGLIVPIGEWVIRRALSDMAEWEEGLTVSINLSPAQMRSATLVMTIVNALARSGVDPSLVCFEITESVLLHDSEANIETLHKIRSLGVHIALDDFGTGYSSLNYLRSFPFDKIKIDRCFVNEIDTREDCRAIVRSVVNLATSLGMTTIAEGVERIEQAEHLRAEGCDLLQGFLYSKAVPTNELTDLRKREKTADQFLVELAGRRADEDKGRKQRDGTPISRAA